MLRGCNVSIVNAWGGVRQTGGDTCDGTAIIAERRLNLLAKGGNNRDREHLWGVPVSKTIDARDIWH
jgi:hypothetical protein